MKMKVFPNARSGSRPKIHPQVETLGAVKSLKGRQSAFGELHHLGHLLSICAHYRFTMLVGRDHQMPGRVGKQIEDDEIVKRLSGRRIHPGSGRIYHILHNSPKVPNKDDVTGESLIQRNDDTEATIRERLRIYHQQTKPVLSYYKEWQRSGDPDAPCYISINGHADVDEVRRHIFAELKKNSQK